MHVEARIESVIQSVGRRGAIAGALLVGGFVGLNAAPASAEAPAGIEAPADRGNAGGNGKGAHAESAPGNSEVAHENRGQSRKNGPDEAVHEGEASTDVNPTDTKNGSTFSQPADAGINSRSPSTPDQDGKGADHGEVNNDKTGPGTDPNNGCGNEPRLAAPRDGGRPTDDDNNGNCPGSKQSVEPEPCPTGKPMPPHGSCQEPEPKPETPEKPGGSVPEAEAEVEVEEPQPQAPPVEVTTPPQEFVLVSITTPPETSINVPPAEQAALQQVIAVDIAAIPPMREQTPRKLAELPKTGVNVGGLVSGGVGTIGVGAFLSLAARRRRTE